MENMPYFAYVLTEHSKKLVRSVTFVLAIPFYVLLFEPILLCFSSMQYTSFTRLLIDMNARYTFQCENVYLKINYSTSSENVIRRMRENEINERKIKWCLSCDFNLLSKVLFIASHIRSFSIGESFDWVCVVLLSLKSIASTIQQCEQIFD